MSLAAAAGGGRPALVTTYRPGFALDPWLTLGPLRHGPGDPTHRFDGRSIWRAARSPAGAVTLHLDVRRDGILASAWGPGAEAALEALPRLLGSDDRPEELRPAQPWLRELVRRFRGLRFGRTDAVLESLVPAIVEQKVTGADARRAWRALVTRHGEPAPGPGGLRLPPDPARLRSLAAHEMHPLGIEMRRAVTIRRVGELATRLEAATTLPPEAARARLQSVPGVGPWTAAETMRAATGDPDAVSVGDYHLPHLVAWALAGEPRGDDARMLELLEPYHGQRARLVRLLEVSGLRAPRYGPRRPPRSIAAL